ncbi:MAG TPA: bacteriohemerythrin [Salinivirga sp.]|uniref:bacteriohemerythrin n=1 Tax=Salinivirga sp. TaxID=1970192 RepID=UPI002B47B9DD|nr:bacteriohemerythrin [Salinivirga sp.]HKK59858.1 bacteriohemerythrin [Salinivirga sp.]
MALFEWEPRYSVHIDEFDEHHQQLLALLRKLHQSMLDGQGKQVVGSILDDLKSYTQYHFRAEEEKMELHGYPKIAEHKNQHKKLIDQLEDLIKDYKADKRQITTDTYRFLNNWLTNHIMSADKQYTAFFKAKGM